MDVDDLAARLSILDLSEDEAQLYARLLQVGPSKAGTLSAYVSLSRSSLYRILDDLARRGIVSKSMDRPTIYAAEDPEAIIEERVREMQRRREELDKLYETTLVPLKQQGTVEQSCGTSPHRWTQVEGVARIYEVTQTIANRAQRRIWVASNDALSFKLDLPAIENAWKIATGRARQGVQTRFLMDFHSDRSSIIPDWVPTDPIELRHLETDRCIHFVIGDDEILLWARTTPQSQTEGQEPIALWTNAPGVLATHTLLFQRLWPQGEPVRSAAEQGQGNA